MSYVIVGAGPAGVAAAEKLRELDKSTPICMIGDEAEPPYSRMAIPYLLKNQVEEHGTYLRPTDGHFARLNVEIKRQRVSAVDPDNKQLTLDDGSNQGYGKLLLATGGRPIAPPIPGIELPGVHACWTLEDARYIMQRAKQGAEVILLGAGFISTTIIEGLVGRGAKLTIVEMEERMVPRMMSPAASAMIKSWCESRGITILTGTRANGIEDLGDKRLCVDLDNGEKVAADLVILGTGVTPNVEFLEGSGIEVEHGIVVDEYLATNTADVYAAGDAAHGLDFSSGTRSVLAIQPVCVEHGHIAAINMVQGNVYKHRGSINMNILDTAGLISCSFGCWDGMPGGDFAEINKPEQHRYLNLQFKDDVLVGASSVGYKDNIGVLQGLISSHIHLGAWKQRLMENPEQFTKAYIASSFGDSSAGSTPVSTT